MFYGKILKLNLNLENGNPKILHITQRDFFKLYFFHSDQ